MYEPQSDFFKRLIAEAAEKRANELVNELARETGAEDLVGKLAERRERERLRRQLSARFGELSDSQIERISRADGLALEDYFDRLLFADTIEGVLGEGPSEPRAADVPAAGSRRCLRLNPPGLFPFTLSRLTEAEGHLLSPYGVLIKPESSVDFSRAMSQRPRVLAKAFLGAERVFGRTSQLFDPWQCSFRFHLLLTAARGGVPIRYGFVLRDVRGAIGADLFRLQDERRPELASAQAPVDNELSTKEIHLLTDVVIDFLSDVGESLVPDAPSFYRAIRDGFVVYGCRSGKAFERKLKMREEYEKVLAEVAAELDESQREREREDIEALLGDVFREEIRQR